MNLNKSVLYRAEFLFQQFCKAASEHPFYGFRALGASENAIANCFWSNSHFGLGVYIFNRPHLDSAATYQKLIYATFGSAVFNFGSLLLLVTVKDLLPKCPLRRMAFGFLSSICLLFIGKSYMDHIDRKSDEN